MRAQSALEFIVSYGWAILIIAIAAVGISFFLSAPARIPPNTCQTTSAGAYCNAVSIESNAVTHSTQIVLDLINSQGFEVVNPYAYVSINSTSNSPIVDCIPGNVLQGGTIICVIPVKYGTLLDTGLHGNFYLSVQNCQLAGADCQNPTNQIFSGTFLGYAQIERAPTNVLLLNSVGTPQPGESVPVIATLLIGNFFEPGATISFAVSNSLYSIEPNLTITNKSGKAKAMLSGPAGGNVVVSANFGPIGNSVQVGLAASMLYAGRISPSNPSIDAGSEPSITLYANASGGAQPYNYAWYNTRNGGQNGACSGIPLQGSNAASYAFNLSDGLGFGPNRIYYQVTDSTGKSSCSLVDTVTLSQSLSVISIIARPDIVNGGQGSQLTATWSGGTAPYSIDYYSGSSQACSSDTIFASYGGLGSEYNVITVSPQQSTYYCFTVKDSADIPESNVSSTEEIQVR